MKKIIYILILFFTPAISFARPPGSLNEILWLFINVLGSLIPILIGLAGLLFIWGLLRYYISDRPNTKKEAVNIIGYGVVAIFVMVSLWGIVNVINNTFGLNETTYSGNLPIKEIDIDIYGGTF
jgi:hypothetical protein